MGIDVRRLIVVAFLVSGALIGLAAAMDIQGIFGYMRADWNPAYGLAVVPLVFLARMNALALIPFAALFSMLSIGGPLCRAAGSRPERLRAPLHGHPAALHGGHPVPQRQARAWRAAAAEAPARVTRADGAHG